MQTVQVFMSVQVWQPALQAKHWFPEMYIPAPQTHFPSSVLLKPLTQLKHAPEEEQAAQLESQDLQKRVGSVVKKLLVGHWHVWFDKKVAKGTHAWQIVLALQVAHPSAQDTHNLLEF